MMGRVGSGLSLARVLLPFAGIDQLSRVAIGEGSCKSLLITRPAILSRIDQFDLKNNFLERSFDLNGFKSIKTRQPEKRLFDRTKHANLT